MMMMMHPFCAIHRKVIFPSIKPSLLRFIAPTIRSSASDAFIDSSRIPFLPPSRMCNQPVESALAGWAKVPTFQIVLKFPLCRVLIWNATSFVASLSCKGGSCSFHCIGSCANVSCRNELNFRVGSILIKTKNCCNYQFQDAFREQSSRSVRNNNNNNNQYCVCSVRIGD